MKKFNLFLSILAFLFFSCAENLENHDSQQKSGNVIIKIENANSFSRFVYPAQSFDISQVKNWTLTFTQITPVAGENKFTLKSGQNSVTLGVGTYSLDIEGSYTITDDNGGSDTVELNGTKTNITVTEGKSTQITVAVGLKKSDVGKGTLSIELGFNLTSYNEYINNFSGEKLKDRIEVVLKSKEGNDLSSNLSITSSDDNQGNRLTVSGKEIPSGYYNLELYANYAAKTDEPIWRRFILTQDALIEIADGKDSMGSYEELVFPTEYTYYASKTGSLESNGLSQSNPGNLYTILKNIYANNAVSVAQINYSYSDADKMEFDVSKVQGGKQVTISYQKQNDQNLSSFIIDESGLITFGSMKEDLSLTTTNGNVKKLNVKSVSEQEAAICLNKGVYLDFSDFVGNEQSSSSISFDVDDIEYYEDNPILVSSVSLGKIINKENDGINFYKGDEDFVCSLLEKKISDKNFEYIAEQPSIGVKYSQEEKKASYDSEYIFGLYNATSDATAIKYDDNISVSAWCSDENENIYISAFDISNSKPNSLPYFIKYEKQKSGAYFSFTKKKIECSLENLPASMCTDGEYIWYVNSVAKISADSSEDSFVLFNKGSWIYNDSNVYRISISNPSNVESFDFSGLFENGKVTAIYYNSGKLYVSGFKSDLKARYEWQGYSDTESKKHEIYNRTFSVYELSEPYNVSSARLVSDVYTDKSEIERLGIDARKRVRSYSSITDMAIINGSLYVLENTYRTEQVGTDYPTGIVTGSLRCVTDGKIYSSYTYIEFDNSFNKIEKTSDFVLPRKIIAIVPKKLKLVLCDSQENNNYLYNVDLSDIGKVSIERSESGSGYNFDSFVTGSALIGNTMFDDNSVFTQQASTDTLISE